MWRLFIGGYRFADVRFDIDKAESLPRGTLSLLDGLSFFSHACGDLHCRIDSGF